MTLDGTTFSGDPITTLGNTLRSICYVSYYLRSLDPRCYRLFVAGDDVMVMVAGEYADQARQLIKNQTSRDNVSASSLG